jgi:hypothetical protein
LECHATCTFKISFVAFEKEQANCNIFFPSVINYTYTDYFTSCYNTNLLHWLFYILLQHKVVIVVITSVMMKYGVALMATYALDQDHAGL